MLENVTHSMSEMLGVFYIYEDSTLNLLKREKKASILLIYLFSFQLYIYRKRCMWCNLTLWGLKAHALLDYKVYF